MKYRIGYNLAYSWQLRKGHTFLRALYTTFTGVVAPIPQPKNWDPMQPGQQLLTVDISLGTKEFEEVEKNIKIAPRDTIKEILKVPSWIFQLFTYLTLK